MRRCPCCNARLGGVAECSRCGADLSRVLRCKLLAQQWLVLSFHALKDGRTDIAAMAVKRALSYRQTNEGRVFRAVIIHHLYDVLYNDLAILDWQHARQVLSNLHLLEGNSETLNRFKELLDHLAKEAKK